MRKRFDFADLLFAFASGFCLGLYVITQAYATETDQFWYSEHGGHLSATTLKPTQEVTLGEGACLTGPLLILDMTGAVYIKLAKGESYPEDCSK